MTTWPDLPCRSSSFFPPKVISAEWKYSPDEGCQEIEDFGVNSSPASSVEGIKPAFQLLGARRICRGDDSGECSVFWIELYGICSPQVVPLVHLYLVFFDTEGGIAGVLGLYLLEGFIPNLVVYVGLVFSFRMRAVCLLWGSVGMGGCGRGNSASEKPIGK